MRQFDTSDFDGKKMVNDPVLDEMFQAAMKGIQDDMATYEDQILTVAAKMNRASTTKAGDKLTFKEQRAFVDSLDQNELSLVLRATGSSLMLMAFFQALGEKVEEMKSEEEE